MDIFLDLHKYRARVKANPTKQCSGKIPHQRTAVSTDHEYEKWRQEKATIPPYLLCKQLLLAYTHK